MTDRTLLVAVFNEAQRWSLPEALVDRLRAGTPGDVRVVVARSREEFTARLDETDLLLGLPVAGDQAPATGPRLKFVQLARPHAESLAPIRRVLDAGARVAGTAPIRATAVSEHAVALTLALLRRIDDAVRSQAAHRWESQRLAGEARTLAGSTVGVVGYGHVGRAIAARLAPFGCEIIATIHDDPDAGGAARLLPGSSTDELLGRSNVVILADDRFDRVRPILDRSLFASINPGALLVNVASGTAFSESELLRAMRRGLISAAALDVFAHRPLPPTSPLWSAPNVLMTPAIGAAGPDAWRRAVDVTIENIRRFDSGERLLDEVGGMN